MIVRMTLTVAGSLKVTRADTIRRALRGLHSLPHLAVDLLVGAGVGAAHAGHHADGNGARDLAQRRDGGVERAGVEALLRTWVMTSSSP
jgi:hypothetical protein